MGISIGLVGLGAFSLFKAHPLVDRIAFCDREPERVRRFAEDAFYRDKFDERDTYSSLEEILQADLDAVALFIQP